MARHTEEFFYAQCDFLWPSLLFRDWQRLDFLGRHTEECMASDIFCGLAYCLILISMVYYSFIFHRVS